MEIIQGNKCNLHGQIADLIQNDKVAFAAVTAAIDAFRKNYDFVANETIWDGALQSQRHDPARLGVMLKERRQVMIDLAWRRTDLLRRVQQFREARQRLGYATAWGLWQSEPGNARYNHDFRQEDAYKVHNNLMAAADQLDLQVPCIDETEKLALDFGKYEQLVWEGVRASYEQVAATAQKASREAAPVGRGESEWNVLGPAYPNDGIAPLTGYSVSSAIYSESFPHGLDELPRSKVGLVFKSGDYSSYIPTEGLAKALPLLSQSFTEARAALAAFKAQKGRVNEKAFRERMSYLRDRPNGSDNENDAASAELAALMCKQDRLRLDFESARLITSAALKNIADSRSSVVYHLVQTVRRLQSILKNYCSSDDFAQAAPSAEKMEVMQLMLLCLAADYRIRLFGARLPKLVSEVDIDEMTGGEAQRTFEERRKHIAVVYAEAGGWKKPAKFTYEFSRS